MNRLYTNPSGTEFVEFAEGKRRGSLTTEIATRDIEGFWGTIYNTLPNPDPVLRRTGKAIDILDEIKREPHVSSCSTSREAGVMKRLWKLYGENASSESVTLIEQVFKSLKMRQVLREMLEAWGYGYQVSEVIWQRQGNYLLPVKIVGKPQSWFFFGRENELRIRTKNYDLDGSLVDNYKFLLTQYRASYSNPYGEAQYSMCFWPVTFKKGGLKFWAVFLEKFGMPHAVGKLPRSATDRERGDLLDTLVKMVRDACAVFPDDASIELLQYSGTAGSSDAYERFARYHDGQISSVLLGHSAAADSTPGRLGGEDTALEVRGDIVDNDCSMIEDSLNTLIQWIHELNPTLGQNRCAFKMYEESDVDSERAERDSKLMQTGSVKLTKTYFTKRYDYDDEDIEVVDPPPAGSALPQFAAPPAAQPDSQSAVDTLSGGLPDSLLQKQVETLLKPVIDLIEMSSSYEDVRAGVVKLFPDLNTSEIEQVLEKAAFLGETWGRLNTTE